MNRGTHYFVPYFLGERSIWERLLGLCSVTLCPEQGALQRPNCHFQVTESHSMIALLEHDVGSAKAFGSGLLLARRNDDSLAE